MDKQKRIGRISLGVALCLLIGAPSFAAIVSPGHSIKLEYALNNSHYGGGAFKATNTSSGSIWTTFCLEVNEYFSPGSTYNVDSVGLNAIGGGAGTGNPGSALTHPFTGYDPISPQTAYLYNAFLNNPGALGYDGSGAKQKSLQIAFWYLENEITSLDSMYTGDAHAKTYVNYALGYAGNDYFGVKVFNPVTVNHASAITARNQSMLYQSVPEAGALLLFGTGLIGLVGYRRVRRMQ